MDSKLIKRIIQTKGPTLFELEDITVAAFNKPGERAFPELKEGMRIIASISDEEKPKLLDYKIVKLEMKETALKELDNEYQKLLTLLNEHNGPIIIRHDNDVDGFISGLLMQELTGGQRRISRQPYYSLEDANRDYKQDALVIILDNGSSTESKEGIKRLKDLGLKVAIIDHHEVDESIQADVHVNPRKVNLSHHNCTGILTYEFVNAINKVDKVYAEIARIADHSDIERYKCEAKDRSESLDYEIRKGRTENEFILKQLIEGKLTHKETIQQLKEEILPKLIPKNQGKAEIYNLEPFTNRIYPTIGVIMNWLTEDKTNYFIIGIVDNIISMRSDNTNLMEIAKKYEGGGHEDRATIKADPSVISEFV